MATDTSTAAAAPSPTNAEICHFFFEPAVDPEFVADPEAAAAPGDATAGASAAVATPAAAARRGKKRAKGAAATPAVSANGRANRHRCRLCWNVYTQNASTGYTNLMTHLRIKHADWPELFRAQQLPLQGDVQPAANNSSSSSHNSNSNSNSSDPTSRSPVPQRMTSGRKRGPVYGHFVDLPAADGEDGAGKKTKRVRCAYCGAHVPQVSGRLKAHLASVCTAALPAVKSEFASHGSAAATSASDAPHVAKRPKRASLELETAPVVRVDHASRSTPVKSVEVTPLPLAATAVRPDRHAKGDAAAHAFEDKLTAALVAMRVPWSLLDNAQFQEALALLAYPSGAASGVHAVEFPLTAARASSVVVDRLASDYDRRTASWMGVAKFVTLLVDRRRLPASPTRAGSEERVQLMAVDERRQSFLLSSHVVSAGASPAEAAASLASDVLEPCVRSQPFPEHATLFLCSDATDGHFSHLRRRLRAPSHAAGGSFALLGSCMAQQSALLLKDLVCETRASNTIADAVAIATALRQLPEFSRAPSATDWASVARTVHAVASHERRVRDAFADAQSAPSIQSDAELALLAAVVRDESFWSGLRAVDALLTPLHACAAMSELPSTTSGQYVSLWLWALALALESPLLREDAAKARFTEQFFRRLNMYVEDHQVVSLVLDPRVRGAGLSSSGLRRARGVAVRVAAALVPALDETSFVRSYNDYVKKQGDFGDDGLWNAANTSDPLQFWSDFDGDAMHGQLARVALAVSAFVPHARSLQAYWASPSAATRGDDSTDGLDDAAQAKIRFAAAQDAPERRVSDMVARYGALVGIQPEHSEGMGDLGAAVDRPLVQPISRPLGTPDLEHVLGSLVDHLDQDVADVADAAAEAQGGANESGSGSGSGSATKIDASWLDASAAGAAQVQSAVVAFFDSVGSTAARLSMEMVL